MATRFCFYLALLLAAVLPASAADQVHFGQDIKISANETAGDLVCFLCSVDVQGEVHGDIVVFGGSLHLNGPANQDVVVFGGGVNMEDTAEIGQDLVVFGGRLNGASSNAVHGDTVIFPILIFLPGFLVLFAFVWGAFVLIRWIIDHRRPAYAPPQFPPRR